MDMFAFALALLLSSILDSYRYVETYCFGKGQTEVIQQTSIRDLRHGLISLVFYLAATIVAGINYFSDSSSTGEGEDVDASSAYTDDQRF